MERTDGLRLAGRFIESSIECLRDPFIVLENGVYYAYGTGWVYYKNSSGSLESGWVIPLV